MKGQTISVEELLELYAEGERNFAGVIIEYSEEKDLSGCNLSGANFREAKFNCVYLIGTDFSGADLSGARMDEMCLNKANLSG
ncbi:pentapeptide repeat-containing protein, partial [Kamptonema formosum]|uniref:pentapeptide repeat-containing protein n=1 Tax=Kamptonema formosum TaxID=331992 RepID=UPI00036E32DB